MESQSPDFSYLKPSSTFPKTDVEKWILEQAVGQSVESINQAIEPFKIDKEIYHQATQEADSAIRNLFHEFGLEQSKPTPQLLVISNDARPKITHWINKDSLSPSIAAFFNSYYNLALVFEPNRYKPSHAENLTINNIFHEMFHALANTTSGVVRPSNTSPLKIFSHCGFATYTIKGVERAASLEEGVTVHYTNQLVSKFLQHHNLSQATPHEVGLAQESSYQAAEKMVQQIITDGGKEMEKLLLAARLGGSRRQLFDALQALYGPQLAREIFTVPTQKEPLDQLTQQMKRYHHPGILRKLFRRP